MSNDERLELPDVVSWPIFPFEGDMRVREIVDPLPAERVRVGDPGGAACFCQAEESGDGYTPESAIWSNERWCIRPLTFNGRKAPFPAYMLETVEHLDIHELDDEYAAEMGLLTVKLDRAIMSIEDVGRVHFNRWGDGAYHFHVWFLGRPLGAWQFSGYTLPLWGFTLPSLSDEVHAANDKIVAASLSGPRAS